MRLLLLSHSFFVFLFSSFFLLFFLLHFFFFRSHLLSFFLSFFLPHSLFLPFSTSCPSNSNLLFFVLYTLFLPYPYLSVILPDYAFLHSLLITTERLKRRKTFKSVSQEFSAWKIDLTEVDIKERQSAVSHCLASFFSFFHSSLLPFFLPFILSTQLFSSVLYHSTTTHVKVDLEI